MGEAVSIVIPAYNPAFFRKALVSALKQDQPAAEIFVGDNCPDESVREICAQFPSVNYRRNPHTGQNVNFDFCIENASGDLLKFLHDDDELAPNCLRVMTAAREGWKRNGTITLVGGRYHGMDEDGRIGTIHGPKVRCARTLFLPGFLSEWMLTRIANPLGPLSCVLFARSLAHRLGPGYFQRCAERARGLVDAAFYIEAGWTERTVYLAEPTVRVRRNRFQSSVPGNNPHLIRSVTSWEVMVRDAMAAGRLRPDAGRAALLRVVKGYRFWSDVFPELAADAARLEAELRGVDGDLDLRGATEPISAPNVGRRGGGRR